MPASEHHPLHHFEIFCSPTSRHLTSSILQARKSATLTILCGVGRRVGGCILLSTRQPPPRSDKLLGQCDPRLQANEHTTIKINPTCCVHAVVRDVGSWSALDSRQLSQVAVTTTCWGRSSKLPTVRTAIPTRTGSGTWPCTDESDAPSEPGMVVSVSARRSHGCPGVYAACMTTPLAMCG